MSSITQHLEEVVRFALERAERDGIVPLSDAVVEFERPKRREHGDWATNVALVAGKGAGNPRDIAGALVERMPESDLVERVEVAGPGFLNFHLAPAWLHDVVRRAADETSGFGRSDVGAGTKVNVEYVSANPTGPMNVVSGRHAAVGDTIGNLLEATGHEVTREYYFNDTGRQMMLFARSVAARYLESMGREAEIPEEGYRGEYVKTLAEEIAQEVGDPLVDRAEDELARAMLELAVPRVLGSIKESLKRYRTRFDVWFTESKLHSEGDIENALQRLREKGYVEEREGALWFRSSLLGDDKDRVVIRSNGEPTYFAADIGYLLDKFGRSFDKLIYLWGPDHHGTVPRLLAAVEALGFERERVEVPLVQVVTLVRGGEALKGSKRAGVFVTLDELIDEVGVDAARYTFLTRSTDAPLEFDIESVKEQAPENPVYYVQYAHARICSILRKADAEGIKADPSSARLELLVHESEDALMRKLAAYEGAVLEAADQRAPQKITRYVEELAATFTAFYRDCKVISEDRDLSGARLSLCVATRSVIASALGLLGVEAPESM